MSGSQHSSAPAALPPLRSGVLVTLLGSAAFNLGRLGTVILLAKLAPPAVLGAFGYATALAGPVVLLCGLELRAAFVSDTANLFCFAVYRRLRWIGLLIATACLAALLVLSCGPQWQLPHVLLAAGVCAGRIVLARSELDWGLFQKHERLDLAAWGGALRGAMMFGAFAAWLPAATWVFGPAHGRDEAGAWAATLAAWTYTALWLTTHALFERRFVRRLAPHETPAGASAKIRPIGGGVATLAAQTLPLGLVQGLIALCESIPWLVLGLRGEKGREELGYFGALAYLAMGAGLLLTAATTAAGRRLAVYRQTDAAAFRRLTTKLSGLALALAAAFLALAALLARPLLARLYRAEFEQYADVFMLLSLGQGILLFSSVFGAVTTFARRFWIQVPMHVIVVAATALAAWWWMRGDEPIRGAAWTALVRAGTQTLLYGLCVVATALRTGNTAGKAG